MSIDWVINNSKYEISSKEHLLQLMTKGTLLTDSGSTPTDYWSSDYIQTTDIDLESDSNITPIGTSSEPFTGSYDGSEYAITDWTHENISENNVGLFGYTSAALIQNINMEGTWVLSGGSQCGFLVGACGSSSGIYNATADFSSGSITSSGTNVGGLIGSASASILEGLTTKGSLSSITGSTNVGGVVGSLVSGTNLNYVRNFVKFTSTPSISGTSCSGICSHVSSSNCTYILNAMHGSITGADDTGGVFSTIENNGTNNINHVVCSMSGDISSTGTLGSAGGVASNIQSDGSSVFSIDTLANYSSSSINGTQDSGGIAGSIADGVEITNSVIAMNGTVGYAGVQTLTGSNNDVQVQIIDTFGLAHTNSGTTVSLTALTGSFGMHAGFSDLEYFAMEGTDTVGNNYLWEFIISNLSGSSNYSQYTHIVISSSDVCGPVEVQVNLPDNSVEYVYFQNIGTNEVVAESGISISYSSGTVLDALGSVIYPTPPLLITATTPFSAELSWDEVTGSVGYRVDYGLTSSGSMDKSVTTENINVSIMNLDASSQYTFQVYSSSDGTLFDIESGVTGSATTLANVSSSYLLSKFLNNDVYDFSSFSPEKSSQIASIVETLLGQDESVLMNVNGQVRELLVAGVSGGTIGITDGDEYLLPFKTSDGSSQSITLEGIYEGLIEYDELSDSITIDGQSFAAGDSVVIGNTRITLQSV